MLSPAFTGRTVLEIAVIKAPWQLIAALLPSPPLRLVASSGSLRLLLVACDGAASATRRPDLRPRRQQWTWRSRRLGARHGVGSPARRNGSLLSTTRRAAHAYPRISFERRRLRRRVGQLPRRHASDLPHRRRDHRPPRRRARAEPADVRASRGDRRPAVRRADLEWHQRRLDARERHEHRSRAHHARRDRPEARRERRGLRSGRRQLQHLSDDDLGHRERPVPRSPVRRQDDLRRHGEPAQRRLPGHAQLPLRDGALLRLQRRVLEARAIERHRADSREATDRDRALALRLSRPRVRRRARRHRLARRTWPT